MLTLVFPLFEEYKYKTKCIVTAVDITSTRYKDVFNII